MDPEGSLPCSLNRIQTLVPYFFKCHRNIAALQAFRVGVTVAQLNVETCSFCVL